MNNIRDFLGATLLSLFVIAAAADAQGKARTLVVKGSDTMVNLSASWAEEFMRAHPEKTVAVNGGGSGVGIAALLGGTADICNASRDIAPKEKKQAADSGIKVVEINVALDGISIVVNPANPLNEITLGQLMQVYTGQITNWKNLGGADEKILVFSRETSSGTYVFFQEHVLQKRDYTPSARLMPATSAIIEAVASDSASIGYVGLGYAERAKNRVKVLLVKKDANAPAIAPSEKTVQSGEYSISRPLHCYINGEPKGDTKAFLDFCLSPEGQAIVREQAFVPLK
jgi:phosphate transport system substrate-binding protein